PLVQGKINAVAVTASVDRYQANNPGFYARLQVAGNQYTTLSQGTDNTTYSSTGISDDFSNVIHWVWGRNPANGAAWNSLSQIEGFGVCVNGLGGAGGDAARMYACGLAVLEWDTGDFPTIRVLQPGSA